jgi:asparagine synthase (glutamine-hydrolysing)
LLSGGVDSGSIVSVASQFSDSPLRTFTIGFGATDEDELPAARLVANRYGTSHTEKIVGESEFQASVEEVLNIFDQPFADTSLVPTRAVCAIASKNIKVVLTGDGGDETFGGYNLGTYISPFLNREFLRRIAVSRHTANYLLKLFRDTISYMVMNEQQWNARRHYPRYQSTARRELRILSPELRKDLESYEYRWMYPNNTVSGLDAFRQAQWHHIKNILPGKMLVKIDRCSMQYSIEARAPFLSHVLVEAMMNLPTEIKNPRNNWYKGLLRTWASNRLPNAVLQAPKRGFAVPIAWNALPNLSGGIRNLSRCVDAGLISPDAWPDLRRKRHLLWRILQVEHAIDRGLLS